MTLEVLKQELSLNAEALLKCTSTQERVSLLIQRSNLKDMIIELLETKAAA